MTAGFVELFEIGRTEFQLCGREQRVELEGRRRAWFTDPMLPGAE